MVRAWLDTAPRGTGSAFGRCTGFYQNKNIVCLETYFSIKTLSCVVKLSSWRYHKDPTCKLYQEWSADVHSRDFMLTSNAVTVCFLTSFVWGWLCDEIVTVHSAVPTQIVSRAMMLLNFLTISLLVDAVMICSGSVCQDCQLPPTCRCSRAARGTPSGLQHYRNRNGNLTDMGMDGRTSSVCCFPERARLVVSVDYRVNCGLSH